MQKKKILRKLKFDNNQAFMTYQLRRESRTQSMRVQDYISKVFQRLKNTEKKQTNQVKLMKGGRCCEKLMKFKYMHNKNAYFIFKNNQALKVERRISYQITRNEYANTLPTTRVQNRWKNSLINERIQRLEASSQIQLFQSKFSWLWIFNKFDEMEFLGIWLVIISANLFSH